MDPVKLLPEQVKKLLYGLRDLHDDQRALIAATLADLMRQHAQIWPQDLQRALERLRADFKISETEEKAIFSAVFP